MDELTKFLTARLGEDEALARRAASEAGPDWTWDPDTRDGYLRTPDGTIMADALNVEDDQFRPHVARHDPARALREVAGKRKILAEHEAVTRLAGLTKQELGFLGWYREWVLKNLAAAWSDNPDYRQEWAL